MEAASLFKAGLVSVTFRESSPEEILRAVEEAGLEGIEWGADRHVLPGETQVAERLRGLMADAGISASAYGSYYKFGDAGGSFGKGDGFGAVLDTAEALGAPVVRVWAGEKGSEDALPAERVALIERCREIAEEAAARSIGIGFEFHSNTMADTPESATSLLRDIGHPGVSSFWQPPLEMSPESRLRGLLQIRRRVSNVHCSFFGQNSWPGILELAEGRAEWVDYLKALGAAGMDRWVSIEFVKDGSFEQFRRDAATLKEWLAEVEAPLLW